MFEIIKKKVQDRFDYLRLLGLYQVELESDELFNTYLEAFPEDQRQEHNCNCCKSFLRNYGNIVTIDDNNEILTLWDFETEAPYNYAPAALAKVVRDAGVDRAFLTKVKELGTDFNHKQIEGGVRTYRHFYLEFPPNVSSSDSLATINSEKRGLAQATKRALDDLSLDSVEMVLELIAQNSIYRGQEFKATLEKFLTHKKAYDKLDDRKKRNYAWKHYNKGLGIRNSSIGTLLEDISKGRDLNDAVRAYEVIVAPQNYKRPTALVTKGMIEKAEKDIEALGIEKALYRRYATSRDITVNNLLFVDRAVSKVGNLGLFDQLKEDAPVNPKAFDKVEEVSLDTFINNVLPTAESVELLIENRHTGNFMTLVAPQYEDAPNIFKWGNDFSWSYAAGVTDSVKERVKAAGGDVSGALRFSIQWNESGDNNIDFDAHAKEPDGNEIYFVNKGRRSRLTGMLDVDIIDPKGEVAVENITWIVPPRGATTLWVHNYINRNSVDGFTAEIEYEGEVHEFTYPKNLKGGESVIVARVNIDHKGMTFLQKLDSSGSKITSKTVWGVKTNKFHKVSMILNSPNHWDGQKEGNQHTFFIINDVVADEKPRGIFNEFLKNDLLEHKRVFELLGGKMKCPDSDEQLSGVGFSSTQNNSVIVKVTGKTTRVLKVKTNV